MKCLGVKLKLVKTFNVPSNRVWCEVTALHTLVPCSHKHTCSVKVRGHLHMYPTVPTRPLMVSPSGTWTARPRSDILMWPEDTNVSTHEHNRLIKDILRLSICSKLPPVVIHSLYTWDWTFNHWWFNCRQFCRPATSFFLHLSSISQYMLAGWDMLSFQLTALWKAPCWCKMALNACQTVIFIDLSKEMETNYVFCVSNKLLVLWIWIIEKSELKWSRYTDWTDYERRSSRTLADSQRAGELLFKTTLKVTAESGSL